MDAIAETIGVKNISTQHTRAEEIKNRKFDFVVSRAVASLKDLWRWSKPLLKSSSFKAEAGEKTIYKSGLICLKGGDLVQEIKESGTKPKLIEISSLFEEESFKEKYLLYVAANH